MDGSRDRGVWVDKENSSCYLQGAVPGTNQALHINCRVDILIAISTFVKASSLRGTLHYMQVEFLF